LVGVAGNWERPPGDKVCGLLAPERSAPVFYAGADGLEVGKRMTPAQIIAKAAKQRTDYSRPWWVTLTEEELKQLEAAQLFKPLTNEQARQLMEAGLFVPHEK
jgi:hypothetical protein